MRQLGMAQFGSALEWGSRGRRFESSYPDHLIEYAPLAQLVEQLTLNQWVQGSSP